MNKRTISVERWRRVVARQPASGLSIAAFCRRAKVAPASFYFWRRKLRVEDAPRSDAVGFAEVQIAAEPAGAARGIELRLPGGRCVVVRPGFDRRTLLELVDTLERGGIGGASREAGE